MKLLALGILIAFSSCSAAQSETLEVCRKRIVAPMVYAVCKGQAVRGTLPECVARLREQMKPQVIACMKER